MLPFFNKDQKLIQVNVRDIKLNPNQPRKAFHQGELSELTESIKRYGILQPLTVRRNEDGIIELIAGERRLRAAVVAGFDKVPCIVIKVCKEDSAVLALIENLQRSNLNFFEEARAMTELIQNCGFTQCELATKLSKKQSTIANKLRLLNLPEHVQIFAMENGLTERHMRALLSLPSNYNYTVVLDYIIKCELNVSQTEEYIKQIMTDNTDNEPSKEHKRRILPVIKDVRLFFNTINNAIAIMEKAGIKAKTQKSESDTYIEYVIRIPKNAG